MVEIVKMDYIKYMLTLAFVMSQFTMTHAQVYEFSKPEKLNESINTVAEETSPLLSPDGKQLYFSRVFHKNNIGGKYAGMDIWSAQIDDSGEWSKAQNQFLKWNNKQNNAVVGIRADGEVVYLLNSYTASRGVAFSKTIGDRWSEPEIIDLPKGKTSNFIGYYMSSDYKTLLVSMTDKEGYGQEDLYVTTRDESGKWSDLTNLGPTINTDGYEISPFLSNDGTILYFSSNSHDTLGEADIFMSERLYDSWTVWTKPKNLGARINSPGFDAYFSTYGDTVSYFSSNRDGEFSDIYRSRLTPISKKSSEDEIKRLLRETQTLLSEVANSVDGNLEYTRIDFEENSIRFSQRADVEDILKKLRDTKALKIKIAFSSRAVNNDSDQTLLISRRIDQLKNFLLKKGIASERVLTNERGQYIKALNMEVGEPEPFEKDAVFIYYLDF